MPISRLSAVLALAVIVVGAPQEPASFNIPLDAATGRPIVLAIINGNDTLHLIFDTGAGGSVIDSAVAKRLSIPVTGRARVGSPGGGVVESDQVTPAALRLGTAELHDIKFTTMDLKARFGGAFDGVLSYRALAAYQIAIDYGHQQLRLSRTHLDSASGTMPYRVASGLIQIPVQVGNRVFALDLDTGNPGTLTFPHSWLDSLTLNGPPAEAGEARMATGSRKLWRARLKGSVRVAGMELVDPEIGFIDLDRGTVGSGFLRDYVITIDPATQRMRIARNQAP